MPTAGAAKSEPVMSLARILSMPVMSPTAMKMELHRFLPFLPVTEKWDQERVMEASAVQSCCRPRSCWYISSQTVLSYKREKFPSYQASSILSHYKLLLGAAHHTTPTT